MADDFDPDAYLQTPKAEASAAFDPDAYLGQKPAATWGETAVDVPKSAGIGVARGVIGLAGLPGDVAGLAATGLGAITGTDPESWRDQGEGAKLPGSEKIQRKVEGYTGEFYQPKTVAGEYAQTAGEFLPAVVGGPESLATRLATRVAVPAIVSETAGQLTKGTVAEPYARLGGALAGGVGAAGVARGLSSFSGNVPAELSKAIVRDKDTPEALIQRLNEARKVRPEATLADVGGENVRGIVERVAQTPGAGRNTIIPALTERQHQQMSRISDDLVAATGTKQTAFSAIQDTMQSRQAAATPLYKQAYLDGDFAVWSPQLERLSAAPAIRGAMGRAVAAWRNQAIADGYGAMNPGAQVERGGQLQFLSGKVPVFPNIQFWDYTKRMLDDDISKAIRAGATNKARALTNLTSQLRNDLDNMVPSYKAARDAWSGPSRFMDAVEDGKSILNRNITSEELTHNLAAMTSSEREAFRIGAVSAIRNRMASNPAKLGDMTTLLRSPDMRAKLEAIMPTPQAAEKFGRALDYEVKSSELTRGALAGSATARRVAAQQEAESIFGELVMHGLTHGTSLGFARRAWNTLGKPVRDTIRSRSDATLAELLTTTQPIQPSTLLPSPRSSLLPGLGGPTYIQGARGFKHGGRVTKTFRFKQ